MNGSNETNPIKSFVIIQNGGEQEIRLGETPPPTRKEVIDKTRNEMFRQISKVFGEKPIAMASICFTSFVSLLTVVMLVFNSINAVKGNALEKKITRIEEISVENKQDFLQIIDEKEKIITDKDVIIKQQESIINIQSSIMGQQSEKIIEQEKEIAELKEELVEH